MRLIVTFPNTHAALAAEKAIEESSLQARIIPVPVEITAECGLALSMSPELKEDFSLLAESQKLTYSELYTLEI